MIEESLARVDAWVSAVLAPRSVQDFHSTTPLTACMMIVDIDDGTREVASLIVPTAAARACTTRAGGMRDRSCHHRYVTWCHNRHRINRIAPLQDRVHD
jgi:hypothetical protein